MRKEGKKYILRESELKGIIKEMILMEVENASAVQSVAGNTNPDNFQEYFKYLGQLLQNVPDTIISDEMKQAILNGNAQLPNDFLQQLFSGFGMMGDASAGADTGVLPAEQQAKNGDAHEKLNVTAACNWLRSNAHPSSIGWCARYVRSALNQGGLSLPHGMRAPSAKYYLNILPANGWNEIPLNQAGQPCDVVVIGPHDGHPMGHIAMCIGNGQWASDFIQKTMCGLRTPPPQGVVHVYRYRNKA